MNREQPATVVPHSPRVGSERVTPQDPRYAELLNRNFNRRFTGKPEYVRLVGSTEQVLQAVQEAVDQKLRVVARSGGCCLEGFVADPAVQVVIDTSLMTEVAYDPKLSAFAIEPGVTLGEAYRKLFLGWGVLLPAGQSPYIGVGGQVMGGGHSFVSREHGLTVDHLYGAELVVVDESGAARRVVATREPADPNRELWWAVAGAGGGNFGIVTRYWFRSPDANDRRAPLPKAPESVLSFKAEWRWQDVNEPAFRRLLSNYCDWCEAHAESNSPFAKLYSVLTLGRPQCGGKIELHGMVTAGADSERLFDAHLTAINAGLGAAPSRELSSSSWLEFALDPLPDVFGTQAAGVTSSKARLKLKDAFLRRRYSERQLGVLYQQLVNGPADVGGGIGICTFGGQVNRVASDATAYPHRDSPISSSYSTGWANPEDEARSLRWLRHFYRELFAESGGVPVPGEIANGATINHPDVDLADPEWNTSGVPWHALYFRNNYPRLQRAKAQWDPKNIFQHALSIRA
jgi:aclacinomycin oxidase